ncbi:uncharacterized protein LOC120441755 isoform X1 [Oreochromis aureus]|uniref:uncharacterized protein LOC120441755 isoform X1 n=1 Tax=Oreochromis aureus TaxID=47969 RepID=UPI001952F72E|nr:uncharacterized protein LOC120441755 isoform X1 [Oreochromis aureus]
MEERLINAVANHPELYDTSCFLYRDRNIKDRAWRKISEEIGQPEDICRRKWKNLRDTYSKEKRTEKEKRSGSAAGSGRRWKFFAVMGFLDPFLTPRETSGNMVRTVENIPPEDQGQPGEAAGECQSEGNGEKDNAAMATGSTHPVRSGASQLL